MTIDIRKIGAYFASWRRILYLLVMGLGSAVINYATGYSLALLIVVGLITFLSHCVWIIYRSEKKGDSETDLLHYIGAACLLTFLLQLICWFIQACYS
jgi:hypothetical protein